VPTAVNDSKTVEEGNTSGISGNVITNDTKGADGAALNGFTYNKEGGGTETLIFSDANTTYTKDTPTGTLKVNQDGSWEFTPISSVDHDDDETLGSFSYTLIDGDGDISNSATNTIRVTDTNASATGPDSTLDEDDLTDGSSPTPTDLIVEKTLDITKSQDDISDINFDDATITGLENLNLKSNGLDISYTLSNLNHTITANNGENNIFTIILGNTEDSTGLTQKYIFTLIDTIDHPNGSDENNVNLPFSFNIADIDSTVEGTPFNVTIIDDVPTANDEIELSVVEGNIALTVMNNLLDNDVKGADNLSTITSFTYKNEGGNTVSGIFGSAMDTQYGSLTVNSDGTWSYTSDATENHTNSESLADSFTYLITDTDGDTSTATQLINVTDGANPTIDNLNNTLVKVYEGDAKSTFNGSDDYNESNTDANKSTTLTPTHKLDFTKGTDDAGITSITWEGITETVTSTVSATITDDDKGTLTVNYDGTWEYTPPATYIHANGDGVNNFETTFSYTVTDTDTDEVTTGAQTIQVDDTLASITSTTPSILDEENLSTGTNPNTSELTKSGDINIDVSNLSGAHDITFGTQSDTTLLNTAVPGSTLSSSGDDISYVVSSDGYTLTMYTGMDSTQNHVMVVTINNPTSGTPTYTAVLSEAFDHETLLLENGNLEFDFNILLTDDDNDANPSTFKVSIIDDTPSDTQTLTVNEESDTGVHDTSTTINTNADATGGVGGNTTITTQGTYGHAVINSDGTLTYTPSYDGTNSIATNYSGEDTVTYTTTLDDGSTKSTTVTVTVNPISDAPGVTADNSIVYTLEDTAIALGLNAPTVTDVTDQNSSGTAGDNPELLGLITLSGIPSGVELQYGSSTYTSIGNAITIKLSNGSHVSDVSGEILEMTIAEFEALKVLPISQDANDFTVTMSVTEYEVDDSGVQITGVAGATSTTTVDVDVLAVTDPVDIKINGSDVSYKATVNEDKALDLQALLSTEAFADLDGSENRSIEISGIPNGTMINGTTITDGTYSIPLTGSANDTIPSLSLTPPHNFSGDITGITIKLVAHDTDTDSTHGDGTTGTTTTNDGTVANSIIYDTSDSVTLNITVEPIADDIADMSAKTTDEDTAATFLSDLDLTDKDTDGTESITKLVITGLDEGSVIVYNEVSTTIGVDGTFTIGDGTSNLDITTIQAATILPPAHSSKDMSITVTATVQDVNDTTSTIDYSKTFDLIVNPIAERTDSDTAGTVDSWDIITQGSHEYTANASEDIFFDLNNADSGFGLSLTNEDSVETTTVLFSPKDGSGADLIGTTFTYDGGTTVFTYNGTAIEIPSSELANLQVKAPAEYSGKLVLTTEIKSIDYDDDSSDPEDADTQTSPGDTLTIVVNPVADAVTLSIKQSFGNEDAGRDDDGVSGIALNIGVSSSDKDGSETNALKLSDIPDGAQIYYERDLITKDSASTIPGITVTDDVEGSWTLIIDEYNNNNDLRYVPEEHSNENIVLNVQAKSTDSVNVDGSLITDTSAFIPTDGLDILIKVEGVADTPTYATPVYDNSVDGVPDDTYNAVVTEDTSSISLNTLFPEGEPNFSSADISTNGDISETLFVTISDLPSEFTITGTDIIKIGDNWVVEAKNFDSIKVAVPKNYSGEINLNLKLQTIEDDGDKLEDVDQPEIPLKILVTPHAESTVNISDSQIEDSGDNVLDFSFNRIDSDEKLESIWINTETIDAGVSLVTTQGTLEKTSEGSPQWIELDVTNNEVETVTAKLDSSWNDKSGEYNFDIRYSVSDTVVIDGGTAYTDHPSEYIMETYTVTVTPVTDNAESSISTISTTDTDKATVSGNDTDGYTVTAEKTDVIIKVPFTLDSVSDKDESEQITSITISGVPEGVSVVNGTYMGDILSNTGTIITSGKWTIPVADADAILNADGTSNTIEFEIHGEIVNFNDETTFGTISIDTKHQDSPDTELSNTELFTLEITEDFDGTAVTEGNETEDENKIELIPKENVQLTEDTPFSLNNLVTATDIGTQGDESNYAILVSNLPDGYNVDGTTETKNVDGTTYYVLYGKGDVDDINTSLANITVNPKTNENTLDVDKVDLDIKVITYTSETNQTSYTVDGTALDAEIAPVSDKTNIAISGSDVAESTNPKAQTITLDLSNNADGTRTIIKDGTVYVKFTEDYTDTNIEMGLITYNGVNINTLTPDANGYYAITGINDLDTDISFEYTPPANYYGTLMIDSKVTTQENVNGATDQNEDPYSTTEIESVASKTITITSVNDGITPFTPTISGNEDEIALLNFGGGELIDPTEKIIGAKLEGIPFGYEVSYDGEPVTGTIIGQENGEYIYEYNFDVSSVEELQKIGVKKIGVEDFSGEISGVTLSVTSGEPGNETAQVSDSFSIVFNPIADAININATKTFEDEYVWTNVNLNANVTDTDGSETFNISFTAANGGDSLDDSMLFKYKDESSDASTISSSFDSGTKTWTLTGIAFDKLNDIQLLYKEYNGDIDVIVTTVDKLGSVTDELINTSDTFNLNLATSTNITTGDEDNKITTSDAGVTVNAGGGANSVTGGTGDDNITTGDDDDIIDAGSGADIINAGAGNDTIKYDGLDIIDSGVGTDTLAFDSGLDLDFSTLGSDNSNNIINNIEKIDLSENGNHAITELSLQDIIDMTDSNNILQISGDSGDSVNLTDSDKAGWTESSPGSGEYTKDSSGTTVTLKIDTDITTNII
ncbi:VCBS domain-containing protein, partial [Poseidonibacter lekithochrous]|uniref:Ig-like domain-containing protein n=1 Tax=Poseidonibacter TaxID=2321187 RepID=UPI001C0A3A17